MRDLFGRPAVDMSQAPTFHGETFDPARDGARLTAHLQRVRDLMADGRWRTLAEIAAAAGCSEASASARLRDLRKQGKTVARAYVPSGRLWRYRVTK